MTPYQYLPLNSPAGETRLLTLLLGTFDQRIETEPSIFSLKLEHLPRYETLSYCWGSTRNAQSVTANGGSLAVIESLATALPYLRLKHRPRVLWIDAICVNQSDYGEQSARVLRMADVYSWADRVVVWLGAGSTFSELAFETIKHLRSRVSVSWRPVSITAVDEKDPAWQDIYSLPAWSEEILAAMEELFSRRLVRTSLAVAGDSICE